MTALVSQIFSTDPITNFPYTCVIYVLWVCVAWFIKILKIGLSKNLAVKVIIKIMVNNADDTKCLIKCSYLLHF